MPQLFDEITESLLRAGIAPRHVKRYVRELSDHLEDLVREEVANGIPAADAEIAARRRLGSKDVLAGAMLKRPELRSITARFPAVVFGAGPLVALIGLIFLGVVFEYQLLRAHLAITHWSNPAAAATNAMITPSMAVADDRNPELAVNLRNTADHRSTDVCPRPETAHGTALDYFGWSNHRCRRIMPLRRHQMVQPGASF